MANETTTIKKTKKPSKKIKTENRQGSFVFKGNDKRSYKIDFKQRQFCEKYIEFQGNGAEAYLEVYKCKNIRVAAALASRVLTYANIIAYIDKRLDEVGFCDDNVKKQHLFTLNQFADLSAKNKAIDMFYRIKGQYAPEKVQLVDPLDELSNAELAATERRLIEALTNKRKN